ncbi:MAG: glycosyltransferase [Chloroflexota bacterium]
MNNKINKVPHVVVYFSDTGGGHRSAAEAIIEALHLEYGEALTTEMVDAFKDYAPLPLNKMPDLYPQMVKAPKLWEASFYATDGGARVRFITASVWPYVRRSIKAMLKSHPADLIVTVHPFANIFALKALGWIRPPFFTVVTDIVTTHALWFDKRADRIFVPSQAARLRGLDLGVPDEKLKVVGFPVADRYCRPAGNKQELREKLGWPVDKPVILVVGGGDGMGPLAKTARAIDESGLDVGLIVVAGRNERLKTYLENYKWENPTIVYGFTREMPEFMRAADILVTKAGAATITEGLNANIPIVMYAKLPGQEDGNVTFVEDAGVGVYAPEPHLVVRALTRWITRPREYEQIVENARRASRPDSARTIAHAIGERLELIPTASTRPLKAVDPQETTI